MTVEVANTKAYVTLAASQVIGRYRRWVEFEDLTQQCWLWLASEWETAKELPEKELIRKLRAAAERYCRKEKAASAGYEPVDEYFYSLAQLKRIIPDAFSPDAVPPREPYRDDERYSEWLTEVSDVRRALRKKEFPLFFYSILREYAEGRDEDSTVRDALRSLQRQLGGSRPT